MSNRTDIVVETDNAEGQVLLSASRVYDLTEDKTQDTINGEIRNTLTQIGDDVTALDGAKAEKADLASPTNKTTPTNDSNPIARGTYFYLDGNLVRATANIGAGAAFTSSNYETASAGGLNLLNSRYKSVNVNSASVTNVSLVKGQSYMVMWQRTNVGQGIYTVMGDELVKVAGDTAGFTFTSGSTRSEEHTV